MPLVAAVTILVALILARGLTFGLPFFVDAVTNAPFLNVTCGLASDLSLAGVFALLFFAADRLAWTAHARRVVGVVSLLIAADVGFTLASHLRYMEHFGMTFRPFHMAALGTGEVWYVGVLMVLQSWRGNLVLGATAVALIGGLLMRWDFRPNARTFAAFAAVALLGHVVTIQLRNRPRMHAELRYNVYTAFYYNWQDYRKVKALPPPTPEQLMKLRGLFGGPRTWAEGEIAKEYPLWQTAVSSGSGGEDGALRDGLRAFLAAEAQAKGPWNVILVISESLRANELHMMGNEQEPYKTLTPRLDALAADGVRFTGVVSAGLRTHFGQTAAGCSLYGSEDFTILQGAPMTNAVCLGDVFTRRGYDTWFIHGADNHFDNQDVFYQFHRYAHIHDENQFPKGTPRGGWGVSDDALFAHALAELKGAKKPFFATVLTLSNHAPFKLPEDAPPEILASRHDLQQQLVEYVDWSTGRFYAGLREQLPHTVLVFIADHGKFWDDLLTNDLPASELVWRAARIPLLVVVPEAPAALKNRTVARLASNTDVAPTLLSLLGWADEPQPFQGEDAFTRTGPVYIDWQNVLLELTRPGGKLAIKEVPGELEDLVGAIGRYNMIAPPRDAR